MTSVAAVQTDWDALLFARLLTADHVRELLDRVSHSHVINLIEDGKLAAINIALDPLGSRRELRVWRWSLDRLLVPTLRKAPAPALHETLLHRRDHHTIAEVAKFFCSTTHHVRNLRDEHQLNGPSHAAAGVERLPRVTRDSLISFLAAREVKP